MPSDAKPDPATTSTDAPANDPLEARGDGAEQPALTARLAFDAVPEARRGPVRTGSPFAKDPPEVFLRAREAVRMRMEFEAGLLRVSAGGAVLSAGVLIGFAIPALIFFPLGALLVTGLGGLMSLFGLLSLYQRWAMTLLLVHVGLFAGSFYTGFVNT